MKNDLHLILAEALGRIEDYFEYRYESKKDKDYVMKVLDDLTKKLQKHHTSE